MAPTREDKDWIAGTIGETVTNRAGYSTGVIHARTTWGTSSSSNTTVQ